MVIERGNLLCRFSLRQANATQSSANYRGRICKPKVASDGIDSDVDGSGRARIALDGVRDNLPSELFPIRSYRIFKIKYHRVGACRQRLCQQQLVIAGSEEVRSQ